MKIFIVSTDKYGWDEYDSHVIAAEDEKDAIGFANLPGKVEDWKFQEIGMTSKNNRGVLHSSLNAG